MNFYACKVTMQNALGHSAVFETFAIASNPDEAADAADKAATEQVLPTGWLITNTSRP